MKTKEQEEAFVEALNALCVEHDIYITLGCGCCNGGLLHDLHEKLKVYELTKYGLEEAR